jgi:hypothetical protein
VKPYISLKRYEYICYYEYYECLLKAHADMFIMCLRYTTKACDHLNFSTRLTVTVATLEGMTLYTHDVLEVSPINL